jgi:1,4-dihydroxy-2-naphthoate octaprenyltransferase
MKPWRLLTMVRAPLWWTPKVLPVVAAAALAAITAEVPGRGGVARVLAMVVSALGVAAFAHLVNDLSDREADRRAGKRNAAADASSATTFALLGATLALAVAPWLVVRIEAAPMLVLAALVATSIAYSVPPLRLKQRGLVGVVADAAVAHVLPTLFAFVLMGTAGRTGPTWWAATVAAVVWSFGFGVRSIVVHQILDAEGDRRAEVATLAVRRGVHRAARTGRDAFALELIGLVGLAAVTVTVAWGAAVFFAIHFGLWLHHRRWEHPEIDSVPTRPGQWLPLAEFYEVWPAIAFTTVLTIDDLWWAWLLGGIVVVFWPAVEKQLLDELSLAAELGAAWVERLLVLVAWARRAAGVVADLTNRVYQRVRVALRETGFALQRAWWAVYRFHWRVRHWFGPLVLFVRRQRRRVRRLMGRSPTGGHHGSAG